MHWTGHHQQRLQAGFSSDMPRELPLQSQRWQNQNKFLQDRHGFCSKTLTAPEIIVVGLPSDGSCFDLLCWTINMAARSGDTVIALQLLMNSDVYGHTPQGNDPFKPLQELCDVKQVQLKLKLAISESAEKWIIEEASIMKATMLVVTTSGHCVQRFSFRHAQRRSQFLVAHVPTGCSIVVVKDYKVLFYKDNHYKNFNYGLDQHMQKDSMHTTSEAMLLGWAKQSGPNLAPREAEDGCQLDSLGCMKVWPELCEASSPRRVLDGPDSLTDSDDSPSSNDNVSLLRPSSRKYLTFRASSHGDNMVYVKQSQKWLPWKCAYMQRSQTFPAVNQTLRTSLSLPYRAFWSSIHSRLSNLWSGKDAKKWNLSHSRALSGGKVWQDFTYNEILIATNYFSQGNLIGKGGHAEVFKGLLSDGRWVAIKRLIQWDKEEQKVIDFLTELGMVCHISHPNITPLLGFCIERGLHLVFHFLQHGSLASWLHGGKFPALQWGVRYKVGVGIARGLKYLHTGCQRRIVHRDIKASNILLGCDFEPQISDFGLAKWLPNECSHHILTPIEGTFGYLAPEYFTHGIVDEKTDVFAFGVLLLELITGREPIEGYQSSLVMWARPLLEKLKVEELVDPRLNGDYDQQEMQCMMMTAALCIQQSPLCRPSISQVFQILTDEISSNKADSLSFLSSQSMLLQDCIFDSEYNCTKYENDLHRHRQLALEL